MIDWLFFDPITWDSLMVWAWNMVCGRFVNFRNGRKNFTLLTFGCPSHQQWRNTFGHQEQVVSPTHASASTPPAPSSGAHSARLYFLLIVAGHASVLPSRGSQQRCVNRALTSPFRLPPSSESVEPGGGRNVVLMKERNNNGSDFSRQGLGVRLNNTKREVVFIPGCGGGGTSCGLCGRRRTNKVFDKTRYCTSRGLLLQAC